MTGVASSVSKVFREATKFDQSRTFDWSRVVANVYSEDSNEEEFERERVVLFSEICKLSHVSANALTVLDLVDYPTLEDAQLLYIVCTYTHLKTILPEERPLLSNSALQYLATYAQSLEHLQISNNGGRIRNEGLIHLAPLRRLKSLCLTGIRNASRAVLRVILQNNESIYAILVITTELFASKDNVTHFVFCASNQLSQEMYDFVFCSETLSPFSDSE